MKQTEVDFDLTNGAWAAAAISPYLINDLSPDPGTPELGGGAGGAAALLPFTRRGKGGKGALSI